MQELEKILEEIDAIKTGYDTECASECDLFDWSCGACVGECDEYIKEKAKEIIRKHMNDGWIPVEEHPKKDYTAVFAVDKHDYYFVAVYDKEHGYRTNDVGADVDNIVAYCLFNPYRPERSEEE